MSRLTAFAARHDDSLAWIAAGSVLATPLFLMHAHGVVEGLIGVTDACFLARCAQAGDWRWLRTGWVRLAFAWWGWVLVCSLANRDGIFQAVLQFRLPLFIAALEFFALRDPGVRRWLWRVIAACAAWITAQSLLQLATGHNLFGNGRGAAGELTGPFRKARAGPPLSRILLPVLIPLVAALLARRRALRTVGAYALLLAGLCMMVLINQRMPALLTAFGMVVSALLLSRLRPVVLAAIVAGGTLVAVSAVVSPPTYQRLVVQFSHQMEGFASSHYGLTYTRAAEIGRQHPWIGLGFDGFRHGCPDERYFRPSLDGAEPLGGGTEICTQHPHNFYMEALDSGGVPGLLLFAALAVSWLAAVGVGLRHNPKPLRVGLFASILIQVWPIASTGAFSSMPMGGWFFLLLGWALAETRHRPASAASRGTEASTPAPVTRP
jgi:hypothetical protein